MKKKLIALFLCVALLAIAVVGGTLAYFTDNAKNENTMVFGGVDIEQWEYQRVIENGEYKTETIDNQTSYVLGGYEQDKPLFPIVGDPSKGEAGWDNTGVRMTQVDSYGTMNVFAGKNAQDKFVVVKNTGKSDAYVRTLVAVEVGAADVDLIGTSYHQTWIKSDEVEATINGSEYYVIEYIYAGGKLSDGSWRHENGVLPAGDTAYPSLSQIYLKSDATNADVEALDADKDGKFDVLVLSQAVQVEGFESAEVALDTAFGDVATANVAEWFE